MEAGLSQIRQDILKEAQRSRMNVETGSQSGVPISLGGARWNFRGCEKEWLVFLSDKSQLHVVLDL